MAEHKGEQASASVATIGSKVRLLVPRAGAAGIIARARDRLNGVATRARRFFVARTPLQQMVPSPQHNISHLSCCARTQAPEFSCAVVNANGSIGKIDNFVDSHVKQGKWSVLFFYPLGTLCVGCCLCMQACVRVCVVVVPRCCVVC